MNLLISSLHCMFGVLLSVFFAAAAAGSLIHRLHSKICLLLYWCLEEQLAFMIVFTSLLCNYKDGRRHQTCQVQQMIQKWLKVILWGQRTAIIYFCVVCTNPNICGLTQLTQGFLHVQIRVHASGIRGDEVEVLSVRPVHLDIDSHSSQRFLSLEDGAQGGSIQKTHLMNKWEWG